MIKNAILFALPGNETLAASLAAKLNIASGVLTIREFPDSESYVRIDSDVRDKNPILVCGLDHPNNKILTLMFAAQTMKEFGANKICLISPYLPYMRQDKRFKSGEAVSAVLFARYLSGWIDHLITIDPHLHRIKRLADLYTIESSIALHAITKMADWIKKNVLSPIIVGPDEESEQWVAEVARLASAPYIVSKKTRYGDRDVSVDLPVISDHANTPVLVDDIISTGMSMAATILQLRSRGFSEPVCVGVHALFTDDVYQHLINAGAKKIVTCNTILHPTNQIDITDIIVAAIKQM